MVKILDCTLRDGGYYTNWDFAPKIVESYISAMNELPVEYVEVGYRTVSSEGYIGKFGYTPSLVLEILRRECRKKIVVMLNEKSVQPKDLDVLLKPIVGLVDMVRIAVDPANFDRAVLLAKAVKELGFEVGFNCMYMSKWQCDYSAVFSKISFLDDCCDMFCMVDSFGGITPNELKKIYQEVRCKTTLPIGFHGHNNLQLGLINTITAIEQGCEFVDATILGMGRGAGNLNMELLLTYLNAYERLDVDFNVLGDVVSSFRPLSIQYEWGTNLPYMLAGANCIPQKEVMEWVTNRMYSFNSIVRALNNRKNHTADNAKYPECNFERKYPIVLVIGGGNTVNEHIDGIKNFIHKCEDIALVFATARHASLFGDICCPKYYVLVGTESRRLSMNVIHEGFNDSIILPPYPRTMGTDVPDFAKLHTFELASVSFIRDYLDSCTTIALQTAMNLSSCKIYSVGYDGYPGNVLSEKEVALTHENSTIFDAFYAMRGEKLESLTPSLYRSLRVKSLYQFI